MIYRKKQVETINNKIKLANLNISTHNYLNIKYILLLILIITLLFKFNYLLLIFIILYICLYDYVLLQIKINKRIKKLESEAIQFFDILVITLNSSSNLEKSLEAVVFNLDNELSGEFKKVLVEIKFGKTLNESLSSLKQRIPSETIQNVISSMIEANIYGNDLVKNLTNQVEFLKEKRLLEAKGEINMIPNKISIVTVIFILPIIILMILGPLLIKIV